MKALAAITLAVLFWAISTLIGRLVGKWVNRWFWNEDDIRW